MRNGIAPILFRRPGWVPYGASLAFDFTRGRGWTPNAVRPAAGMLTTTRASDAYADSNSGFWQAFTSGQPRITDRGLLVEESRTNSIRNNSMQGAVAGVPGTYPNNWAIGNAGGLTSSVVGTGTENGIDYVDLRFAGTSTGTSVVIYFSAITDIAATNTQVWMESSFLSFVGGSDANISNWTYRVTQYDGASGFLSNLASSTFPVTSTQTRQSAQFTMNNASTAYARPGILVTIANGAALDFTLRIGWPQLELGSFATSPIRTTSAAATRAADAITLTSPPSMAAPFSLYARAVPGAPTSYAASQNLIDISDNSTNNRALFARTASNGYAQLQTTGGGVANGGVGTTVVAQSARFAAATAFASGDSAISVGGAAVATGTPANIPTGLNTVGIGNRYAGGSQNFNGYIERVAYFPTRLTNAQLQALTT